MSGMSEIGGKTADGGPETSRSPPESTTRSLPLSDRAPPKRLLSTCSPSGVKRAMKPFDAIAGVVPYGLAVPVKTVGFTRLNAKRLDWVWASGRSASQYVAKLAARTPSYATQFARPRPLTQARTQ